MKKIFAILLVLMLWTMPLVAFAEEATVPTEGAEVENSTTTEEMLAEGEISPSTVEKIATEWDHLKNLFSDNVEDWILSHLEEISVVVTLIMTCFYNMRKHKLLNRSMGTLNNNAITVAQTSNDFMGSALTQMQNASGAVVQYDERITALLEAFRTTAEDKAMLERELVEIKNYLKIESEANIEFANELADLIALANIPNYKKEEFGTRHSDKVKAIIEAVTKAEAEADAAAKMLLPATVEEVKEDVGEES